MRKAFKIVGMTLIVVLITLSLLCIFYFPGYNFRIVEDGKFYGTRQMDGKALRFAVHNLRAKTVINLRGEHPGSKWYDEEAEVCRATEVRLENFSWSKNRIPDPESLARFVNLIETGKGPFLAHCDGGIHRTGVAAAVYLLLQGKDTATARKQFGPMFFNAPIGQLLDLYEGSNVPFKQWALEVYPGIYAALLEKTSSKNAQAGVPVPGSTEG